MSGFCAASDVSIMVKNILGDEPIFSTSTSPNVKAVNSWITTGCGVIELQLASRGYSVPVASTALAFEMLKRCNALWVAARVEESRTNITLAPGERTRGQVFHEQFGECMDTLLKNDLTFAGVSRSAVGQPYAGGISVADKQSNESNTDRVKPRFMRGQFDFPGTIDQTTTTAS